MKKKLLLVLFGGALVASPLREDLESVVSFDHHYTRYLSDLFGCHWKETGGFDNSSCHPTQGTLNYVEYRKARELAKRVFDLQEP